MRFGFETLLVTDYPANSEKLRHQFNYISLSASIFWKYFY